MTTEGNKKRR